ncbi:MAG TPA: hypothetical protein VK898_19365 [Chloroflexota bacterium]|nr:hypothetical protein [Chloroflexota bacterium]
MRTKISIGEQAEAQQADEEDEQAGADDGPWQADIASGLPFTIRRLVHAAQVSTRGVTWSVTPSVT